MQWVGVEAGVTVDIVRDYAVGVNIWIFGVVGILSSLQCGG